MGEPTADVTAEFGDKKISMKSVELNTFITLLILVIAIAALAVGWFAYQALQAHAADAKETGSDFVKAVREQTTVMREGTAVQREQNCLLRFDQKERQANAEFCRQITR